ncbi:NAD(P)/FAD-dependent oxidoreductase [Parasphingorhabdus sp.]|uniref:NAD(P)/FAD-dependent oxidoreductase n=1 Tax=Parasphingorhabdus sp. TaxID=2709688 RepID=UPI00326741CC
MADIEAASTDVNLWVQQFSDSLASGNIVNVCEMFAEHGAWRDVLALTWTIKTFENRGGIAAMLESTLRSTLPHDFAVEAEPGACEGWLLFKTQQGSCKGYVRLDGSGKALTVFTALQDLEEHQTKTGKQRPTGLYDDLDEGTWLDRKQAEQNSLGTDSQPYVLIVGGGQGGLALGARLKVQGVPTLIVDRHAKSGDEWRSRYNSLTLHDPVWYDHMPYVPFPDNWPIYTPKDKLGDFLEAYAMIMELNIWNSTEFVSAAHDENSGEWDVIVERDGKAIHLHPAHVVMAVGNAGFPRKPNFTGKDIFQGDQVHSSEYTSGEGRQGQQVVVIGANNSAHDICADLVENGAKPVMIQRSSTLVLKGETNSKMARALYSEEAVEQGLTTERADFLNASLPLRMAEHAQKEAWAQIAISDAEFYQKLADAGFQLDFGEDGTGLFMKYLRTASGYYIDVGASEMVADGRIGLRSQVEIEQLTENGVLLSDGEELPADMIVFATGFGSMEEWVKRLISLSVAEKIGPCWGYGSGAAGDPGPWEGELRNMWKPTAQDGLWFHGGNLQQSRFYSHYLALQLKARYENVEFAVYDSN